MRIALISLMSALILLLLPQVCRAGSPEQACTMVRAAELPLRFDHGFPVVTVAINGAPIDLILATGRNQSVLGKDSVARLASSLRSVGYAEPSSNGPGGVMFKATNFQIGSLHTDGLTFRESEHTAALFGAAVDGILGNNLLAAYDVDFDIPENKVILFKEGRGCSTAVARLSGDIYSLEMLRFNGYRNTLPFVQVGVGGKGFVALIDTAALRTIMSRNAASELGLDIESLTTDKQFKTLSFGPTPRKAVSHVMSTITVGGLTIQNLPVVIIDKRSTYADVLLGMDFLSRVHIWLGFSSHTLFMQYPPMPSPP